jgi:hypothetical protein
MNFEDWAVRQAEKAVYLGDQIINDLQRVTGGGPLAHLLARARKEAAVAYEALLHADADEAKLIRTLQAEVLRHRDLTRWIGEAIAAAEDADRALSEDDRRKNVEPFLEDTEISDKITEEGPY